MAKAVRTKVRISGNVVEFWEYEKPIFIEGNNGGGRRSKDSPESEKSSEYKKQNDRKSRDSFKSLVTSNFSDGDKFITLTFRDTEEFDIRNVVETNREFKKFMQRLKYKYGNFQYISVIEFQDENKRGAVHYHLMCKLPYVPYETLSDIWGLGFIGINFIKGVDNIGAYLSKYMAKDLGDRRLKGKKNYLPSKNLDKPITVYGEKATKLKKEFKNTKKEVFTDSYESEYFGKTLYDEYNLKREITQTKVGKGLQEELIAEQQIKQLLDQINSKKQDVVPLVDEINQLLEALKNGTITHDKGILEVIYGREEKDVRRRRDWSEISQGLLECLRDYKTGESYPYEEWEEYQTGQERFQSWANEVLLKS
jgi:hypothetical protein